ncbi:hypothetical protein [Butyrivibrio hungatei]|uniref:Uncharacterized protein n=1 Tax=Butyrivibrio hungatei TaxID=185008 RepID=A0A1D9P5N5_9FIRM|nr:hypothetical protein [Butyrivibrio hungatei]AOZ97887.1 hypothetical protein bhn_II088 [Butyrivibrio hungatei]
MDFNQALFEYELKGKKEETGTATIEINFDSKKYGKGWATLKAPNFSKRRQQAIDECKGAWEYFCRGDEEILYSITEISITFEENKEKAYYKKTA